MNEREIGILASTYIEAQQIGDEVDENHPLWWAIEKFMVLEREDPESCWLAILRVLSLNPPEEVLGMLAAGPLEELIELHGDAYINRIEERATVDARFKKLLCGVWQSGNDDVWNRVVEVRADMM